MLSARVNHDPSAPFDYSLFGLHIRSQLRLPELLAADPQSAPDVVIGLGEVEAPAVSNGGLDTAVSGVLLSIAGIARYAIADGSRITIDADPGVPEANVRLYLLGSAMGILLLQRGLLPLHANAIEIGGKAFAFMGMSGSGKSTLAAWFHDHGYRIIADDVCAVRFDGDQRAFVTPGLPRLRLWKEALEGTGRQSSHYSRSYAGLANRDKFDVPIPHETAVQREVELGGVYLLAKGGRLNITELQGLDAAEAVFANTYRGNYVPAAGNVRGHWQSCVELARQTPIFELQRAWDLSRVPREIEQLVAHATQLAGADN